MRILCLDLSKRSAGFAAWGPGDARPVSGAWVLGSEFTSNGRAYARLHENMTGLHRLAPIDAVYWEDTLDPRVMSGHTNIDTIKVLSGLAAHAESWGEVMGCRIVRPVNQTTWRRHFLGAMKRGTKSVDLKQFAMERCRQLGFRPAKHDEAEAIGLLDYAVDANGILAPWHQVLRAPIGAVA